MLGEAFGEYGHFLRRLLVAVRCGNVDAALIGRKRLLEAAAFGQRAAEQLPRSRKFGIELDCMFEMLNCDRSIADFQIFTAEAEAQQSAVTTGLEQSIEIGDGI